MAITSWHRHDLAELTSEGHRSSLYCWRNIKPQSDNKLLYEKLIIGNQSGVKLPGIVRREESNTIINAVPIGFSSPYLVDGHRLRVPTFVPLKEIINITSPYKVLQSDITPRTTCLQALQHVKDIALSMDLQLGVWGSAGLEIHTTLPYTYAGSDLDLLLKPSEPAKFFEFAEEAISIGQNHNCSVDIELELPSGYGVNIKELIMDVDCVLGKGLEDVVLLQRSDVLAMCS